MLIDLVPGISFDNVMVALALAPHCRDRATAFRLVAGFAAAESLAPPLGAAFGLAAPTGMLGAGPALLLVAMGFSLLVALAFSLGSCRAGWSRWILPDWWLGSTGRMAGLAALLALDNLAAGANATMAVSFAYGLASCACIAALFLLGRMIGRLVPPRAGTGLSALLLIAAGAGALG